jgi:hypothetical protein
MRNVMNSDSTAAQSDSHSTLHAVTLPVPAMGQAIVEALASTNTSYRESQIALTAYFLAEKRGFAPGGEFDDWLAAEHREGKSTE